MNSNASPVQLPIKKDWSSGTSRIISPLRISGSGGWLRGLRGMKGLMSLEYGSPK